MGSLTDRDTTITGLGQWPGHLFSTGFHEELNWLELYTFKVDSIWSTSALIQMCYVDGQKANEKEEITPLNFSLKLHM